MSGLLAGWGGGGANPPSPIPSPCPSPSPDGPELLLGGGPPGGGGGLIGATNGIVAGARGACICCIAGDGGALMKGMGTYAATGVGAEFIKFACMDAFPSAARAAAAEAVSAAATAAAFFVLSLM